jgi:hypothetical protein
MQKKPDLLDRISNLEDLVLQIQESVNHCTNLVSMIVPHCNYCGSSTNLSILRILENEIYIDTLICDKCKQDNKK